MRWWVAGLVGLSLGMAAGVSLSYAAMKTEPLEVQHRPDPYDSPDRKIDPRRSAGRRWQRGLVRGVMGWRFFEYPASQDGESMDELRFQFTRPAEILQVDVSVDVNDPRLTLVEFAVGVNGRRYGFSDGEFDRAADWLAHVSWSGVPPDEMDETTRLPADVIVGRGDELTVGAYMGGTGGGDPLRVSPEVVVLYRWLRSAN